MHWFNTINNSISDLGMLGAFLVMVVENIGIPFPTEIGFVIGQSSINSGSYTFFEAVLIITSGHLVGSLIAYSIGRFGDKRLTRYFQNNAKLLMTKERITEWYQQWGSATILITRNFGYVRPWSSLVAGFARVKFGPFLFWTTIGSLIFCTLSLSITKYIVFIWQNYPQFHILMSVIFGILFFGFIGAEIGREVYGKIHRHRK